MKNNKNKYSLTSDCDLDIISLIGPQKDQKVKLTAEAIYKDDYIVGVRFTNNRGLITELNYEAVLTNDGHH